MSRIKWTFPLINKRRKSNYIEDPKIAPKKQKERYLNKKDKQSKDSKNQLDTTRFYDKINQMFKENQEGAPQGTCIM